MFRKCIVLALPIALFGSTLIAPHAAAEDEPAKRNLPTIVLNDDGPVIEIEDADYGGSGCPEGTASVVIIGNTLSILFDEYAAETGYGNETDRKSCNYAVALRVPQGFTIALLKIDYRGFAAIPSGGFGRLRAEYFFAGQNGPVYTRVFPAGYFGDWMETDFVGGSVWSPCGGEVIARGNTSIIAKKSSPYSSNQAELSVDSVDLQAGIVYYFDWHYC